MVKNYNEVLYANERIETERLLLRKFIAQDAEAVLEYGSDEQTLASTNWVGCQTLDEARAVIFDVYMSRPGIWAVVLKASGETIGIVTIKLEHEHDKAACGYLVNKRNWGRGYAAEALRAVLCMCFDKLELNRVEAHHYVENPASGRVMEKAGMRRECFSAQSEHVKGIYRDCVYYGITRGQYISSLSGVKGMVNNYNEALFQNETIVTERLILRKFALKDAEDIVEYGSDAETMEYLVWEGLNTIEEARAAIYDYYWSRNGIWAIEHAQSGKVIGAIDLRLDQQHDKAGFGYVLNRKFWNMGYATEALKAVLRVCFEELGLNRVESQHYAENPASGRVMEKAGMKREGCLVQSEKIKGVFRDCVRYGIVRSDYYSITHKPRD